MSTLKAVAKLAGVSVTTVSQALNGKYVKDMTLYSRIRIMLKQPVFP